MSEEKNALPKGWAIANIGKTAHIFNGNSIPAKRKKEKYQGIQSGMPYVGTKDVSYDHKIQYDNGVRIPFEESNKFKLAPKNSVLVCAEGGSAGRKVAHNEQDIHFGNKLYAIVPDDGIQSMYIFYYCISSAFYHNFTAVKNGLIGGVSLGNFRTIEYPIAPAKEQKRIVSKLNQVQARSAMVQEGLDRLTTLLETFRKSVLASAFRGDLTKQWRTDNPDVEPASVLLERIREERKTKWITEETEKIRARAEASAKKKGKAWTKVLNDKALKTAMEKAEKKYKAPEPIDTTDLPELPKGWCWASIEELCSEGPSNGYSGKSADVAAGTLTMKLSATTTGEMLITTKTTKNLLETLPLESRYFLQEGDLLVQRANSLQYLGAAAVFEGHDQPIIYPDLMMKLRTNHKELTHLLWRYCNSLGCRTYFRSKATGTAGNMPKINGATLKSTPVPLPPFAEISVLLSAINHSLSCAKKISEQVKKLTVFNQRLTKSILAKAFQGELVQQDPNDEPASILLEKIKAEREAKKTPKNSNTRVKKKDPPPRVDKNGQYLLGFEKSDG